MEIYKNRNPRNFFLLTFRFEPKKITIRIREEVATMPALLGLTFVGKAKHQNYFDFFYISNP